MENKMKKPVAREPYHRAKVRHQRLTDDKFYHTTRWRKLRRMKLNKTPNCEECERKGVTRAATEVDHIIPIAYGGSELAMGNLQSLCHSCHSRKTMTELNKKRYGKG